MLWGLVALTDAACQYLMRPRVSLHQAAAGCRTRDGRERRWCRTLLGGLWVSAERAGSFREHRLPLLPSPTHAHENRRGYSRDVWDSFLVRAVKKRS